MEYYYIGSYNFSTVAITQIPCSNGYADSHGAGPQ